MPTIKNNIIRTEEWGGGAKKDFKVFDKTDELQSWISLKMDIQNPNGISINTITYAPTELQFSMHLQNDLETLENLVKWTKSITRDANKEIKKLKEKQELKEKIINYDVQEFEKLI